MERFDHRITEARPAIRDTEDFWVFHDWLPDSEVWKLNSRIENGEARQIFNGQSIRIITFGGGFHYDVEAITHCVVCGVWIGFAETHETEASCHEDSLEAADSRIHG